MAGDWELEAVSSVAEALDRADTASPDVAVVRGPLPDGEIGDLIEDLRRLSAATLTIVADVEAVSDAVRYLRLGAHDAIAPDGDLKAAVESAVELRRGLREAESREERWRKHLIGASRAIERTVEIIRLVGERRSTVLITGETGTGKEVVARAIHLASPRGQLPMISVNCNALPETLLEAELFGHVKGAFTGAVQHRIGRFEQAHGSTLFLDEIGDLPLDMQTKLLRVLQEREFQRVGSSETLRVDVRLIAATNADPREKVKQGKFREDLYYRLNVVPIATPPLRERPEDIPLLAQHFVEKICRMEGIPAPRLTPEALARLRSYSWPGNVRQLENAIEMAVAMSGGRPLLHPSDFNLPSEALRPAHASAAIAGRAIPIPDSGLNFDETIGNIERQILVEALRRANGNKTAAADLLGLKRTTLAAKLKSLEAGA